MFKSAVMDFLISQTKRTYFMVIMILFFLTGTKSAFAQFMFQPLTHVTAFYMNGECSGSKIKIRFLYQEKSARLDINSINFYYQTQTGSWIQFAQAASGTTAYDNDWLDYYTGSGGTWFSLGAVGGHSVTIGNKTNEGSLSYQDFTWNNIPADAYKSNGFINISTGGNFGSISPWNHLSTGSVLTVTLPVLTSPNTLNSTNGAHCTKVALNWNAPGSFPCSYNQEVYRDNVKIATLSSTQTTYDDFNSIQGPLNYYVKAIRTTSTGAIISSQNSNPVISSLNASATPPFGVAATTTRCDGNVSISWGFNGSNPPNFKIYRATSATGAYSAIATISGSERSYLDAPPLRSTNYFYKVATVGTCGEAMSAIHYTGQAPAAPAAPTGVNVAVNGSNNGIIVNWTDASINENGFVIERIIQGQPGTSSFTVPANTQTYTDNSAISCVNYIYTVRAKNDCEPGGTPSMPSSAIRIFPDLSGSFNSSAKLKCSKGYHTNMVKLDWSSPNVDLLNFYRIYRKVYGTTADSVLIGTSGEGTENYMDNTAISGILYKYSIIGVMNCAGFTRFSNISEDIGFRSAFGTVSGNVSYQGGFALNHAKVIVSPSSASFVGASMRFPNATGRLNVPASNKLSLTSGVTLETWFNTTNIVGTQNLMVLTSGSKTLTLRLQGANLQVVAFNGSTTQTVTSSAVLANNYNQASAVLATDSMIIYLNGIRSAGIALGAFVQLPMNNSAIEMGTNFVGYLDEVRVYNRSKTAFQVTEDFSRRVNPDDIGLLAYYTFDEKIVGYNGFFDYSRNASVYNENHGITLNGSFSDSIPSTSQLAYASFTDDKGSYVVTNIGFVGTGQVFTVTPSFETHAFSPINRTVFIGEGAGVHSEQNFTDISSFTVTGTVYYDGTSCPAEGIQLKVDNQTVTKNNVPVTTTQNGAFEIQVPIGNHVITVEKDGHTFSAGRFPSTGEFNFQNPKADIQFIDNTLIKVVGRAVGGPIEAAKVPGLGRSVNNIGKARIHFKSQMGNGCKRLSVTTNDTTGEYVAYLPPLVYTIDTARVPTQLDINFGTQSVMDLTNFVNLVTTYDTVYLPGTRTISRIDSVKYHTIKDFIFYNVPNLEFARKTGKTPTDSAFVGELSIKIDSLTTLSLIPSSPYRYPVFNQFETYNARIYAFDIYTNKDRTPNVISRVPLNGSVVVDNGMATLDTKNQTIEVNDGFAEYSFRCGNPNITTNALNPSQSFTLAIQATFFTTGNNGARTRNWLPNAGSSYRGIVFGARGRGGASFMTNGPEKVDLILRDPPGSASSATWSKNTNYTTIKRYSNLSSSGGNFMGTAYIGAKWETSFGLGAMVGTETEVGVQLGGGFNKNTSTGSNGEEISTLSTSIDLSTGSGSDQVGAKADVFFGHSTNYTFGLADNLLLVKAADCGIPGAICGDTIINGYRIGIKQSISIDPSGIKTVFAYTVGEIEDIIIPNLKKARNLVLTQGKKKNNQARYLINFNNNSDPDYDTKYAANNDDPIWGASRNKNNPLILDEIDKTGPSYTFRPDTLYEIDSVRFYNNQIRIWKETLAKNEKEKYDVFNLNLNNVQSNGTNTSIGKATITRTFATTKSKESTSYEEVYFDEQGAFGFKAIMGGSGVEFQGGFTIGTTDVSDNGTSSDTSTTISYTLNDGDDGDLITVDVVDPGTGNGHVFKLKGGQTSCPYEGPQWANYYKPSDTVAATTFYKEGESVQLTDGTLQRHKPFINIPQAIKFNVPADEAATFNLSLGNISESEDDQTYDLRIIESTNPHGAILTIDGLDPNRSFTVPYGTSINKTLTLRRGPEYYDYENILLIFKSQCDDDLVDSAYITVHFIPTCTKPAVQIPMDKWTLNNSFKDTMNVIISGYDYNFGGLKNIEFQYKPASSSQWNILKTFHKNPSDSTLSVIPSNQPYIEYIWNMRQITDGPYDIRAVSRCAAPNHPDALMESEVNRGLADRINPAPFGNPSPADGILSPNDEISIQFNEPIDNASLSFQNFDIRGVLNGSATESNVSIYFDGSNDYVEVPTGLNLNKKSFSLEFWARRDALGQQVIFSQGIDPNQYFAIGFDAANKFYFQIGTDKVFSNTVITDLVNFNHYTVSYNSDLNSCELFINGVVSNTGNTTIFSKYEGGGKTIIGKLSYDNSLAFKGNLRDFRLWSKTRTSSEILSSINRTLKGTEAGIVANWRFNEAKTNTAKDYIRSRNAEIVNAVWEITPKGRSYRIVNEPLTIEASNIAFTQESDFTIEFWFKGNNVGGNVALFSNGKGDSTDVNPSIRWSIEKDASGKIYVKHKGYNFEAVTTNYFDGNWHHFALVMQRATSLTAFVDGNQQNTVNSSGFEMFGGNKIWIGARAYQPPVGADVLDRLYTGFVDEIRIWSSARTQFQIDRDYVNRLGGTESDLALYIPFELYTLNLGVPILTPSVTDIKSPTRVITGATANGSGLNTETAKIKLQRPVEAINFTYLVNNDRIILTPNTLPALIENVTLDVTVKDVYDLNGNKMQSPRTWIAFVDKNQVKWQDQDFSFNKLKGAALSFNTKIVNSGGAVKQFTIQNLPDWLTASPATGNILPNSTVTVTFTVDPNVNIGVYENEIQVLTDFGYPDGLLIKLKVYAEPPSSWSVNPAAFQNTMSIVGQIRVNSIISTNPDDKLAAFVNGQCRGIANLQYFSQVDRYYAFLNVYSNVTSGETIEFRIWNATEGKSHTEVTPSLPYVANSLVGNITTPQIFNATDKITRYVPITAGWNWISFNLLMRDSSDINKVLKNVVSTEGDIFKDQVNYADFTNLNGWAGTLASPVRGVKTEKSYRWKSSKTDTLVITGIEVNPSLQPIRLDSGWNWIGFQSQRNLSVVEAFSSLNATSGDWVSSQTQFAVYDANIGWVGSLITMLPNKGYVYKSAAVKQFAYPRSAMFSKTEATDNRYQSKYFTYNAEKFEKVMSVVLDPGVCNDALSTGRLSVGAFVGNEVRGITKPTKLSNGKYLYFLNVSSNSNAEEITFKLMDEQNGTTLDLDGKVLFGNAKLIGSLATPYQTQTTTTVKCEDYYSGAVSNISMYAFPNPYNKEVQFNVQGTLAETLNVKILDVTGKLVDAFDYKNVGKSNSVNMNWNAESRGIEVRSGLYFVEVRSNGNVVRTKLVKY